METSAIRKAIELVNDTDKFNYGIKDAAFAELAAIETLVEVFDYYFDALLKEKTC